MKERKKENKIGFLNSWRKIWLVRAHMAAKGASVIGKKFKGLRCCQSNETFFMAGVPKMKMRYGWHLNIRSIKKKVEIYNPLKPLELQFFPGLKYPYSRLFRMDDEKRMRLLQKAYKVK